MKLNLTKGEIEAIWNTAGQMKDDLEYYSFFGKAKYKKFVADYETGMDKLKEAMRQETQHKIVATKKMKAKAE